MFGLKSGELLFQNVDLFSEQRTLFLLLNAEVFHCGVKVDADTDQPVAAAMDAGTALA